MNKYENAEKGRAGESIAEKYLIREGYKILERNWHYSRNAELDIIAEDKDALVFVEVKTRKTLDFGHPFEAVTPYKLQKIRLAAYAYLNRITKKYKLLRIDVIAVTGLENPKIEHLKNVGQY